MATKESTRKIFTITGENAGRLKKLKEHTGSLSESQVINTAIFNLFQNVFPVHTRVDELK